MKDDLNCKYTVLGVGPGRRLLENQTLPFNLDEGGTVQSFAHDHFFAYPFKALRYTTSINPIFGLIELPLYKDHAAIFLPIHFVFQSTLIKH